MVSKTATTLLTLHTLQSLSTFLSVQSLEHNTTIDYPPALLPLLRLGIHITQSAPLFFFLTFVNYLLIPRSWRVSLKRHLLTVVVLAPLLAQLIGRGAGWIESPERATKLEWTSACFEQLYARDSNVLFQGVWCEYQHGITREEVESSIGNRRRKAEYVESLARVCIEGLRDFEHCRGLECVCWMGHGGGEQKRVGEGRNSEREWVRRAFEECYGRFGIETRMSWSEDVSYFLHPRGQILGKKQSLTNPSPPPPPSN